MEVLILFPFVLFLALSYQPVCGVLDLQQLCARCNGTLEIRDGVAHCIVSTEEDMECAQRASAEAYQQGETMVPEMKGQNTIITEEEESSNLKRPTEILVPLSGDKFIEKTELIPVPEEDMREDGSPFDQITAGEIGEAIFRQSSQNKNN